MYINQKEIDILYSDKYPPLEYIKLSHKTTLVKLCDSIWTHHIFPITGIEFEIQTKETPICELTRKQ